LLSCGSLALCTRPGQGYGPTNKRPPKQQIEDGNRYGVTVVPDACDDRWEKVDKKYDEEEDNVRYIIRGD
jgi:hypothetical protein